MLQYVQKIKMETMSAFEKLDKKIDELLLTILSLKEENETLRQELVNIKAQCEVKTNEIERLQELNAKKEREIEEIVAKIESMIG